MCAVGLTRQPRRVREHYLTLKKSKSLKFIRERQKTRVPTCTFRAEVAYTQVNCYLSMKLIKFSEPTKRVLLRAANIFCVLITL